MRSVLLILALTMSACETTGHAEYCDLAYPIRPNISAVDSMDDRFAAELLLHNQTWAAVCG